MSKRPSLALLTAAVVSLTQVITIALLYNSVDWYVDHAETVAVEQLSPSARGAWESLNSGVIPDQQNLAALVTAYPSLEEATEAAPILALLGFGAVTILLSSSLGVFLAFRIAAPITRLTAAAEKIRQGDFLVEVEAGATREVESLATTINGLASELLALEKRLRFNTRAVAHELRTPLTVLQGNLQGMSEGVLELSAERIDALYAQTLGISRLVDQLNTLSLVGTPAFVGAMVETDLSRHVRETVDLFKAAAGQGINCRTSLATAIASVDPVRVRQLLLALLENARRYAGADGPIEVNTGTNEIGSAYIAVEDRGPGMPTYVLDSSFDMFWRREVNDMGAPRGTGLGLTVVKAIADAHGARFTVSNRAGGGACATVTFTKPPLVDNDIQVAAG